jgi:hypothetical protein
MSTIVSPQNLLSTLHDTGALPTKTQLNVNSESGALVSAGLGKGVQKLHTSHAGSALNESSLSSQSSYKLCDHSSGLHEGSRLSSIASVLHTTLFEGLPHPGT